MNDDLKPSDRMPIDSITVPRAFVLAELIALRVRDSSVSEGSRLAADLIVKELYDLARAWSVE